ncbi:sensor histidine kinase [Pseudomonadota bacterium]
MKGRESSEYSTQLPVMDPSVLLGHELGNVLNGLLGMAELLGESGLNTQQSQWLEAIEHSGLQMLALIQPERFAGQGPGINLVPRIRRVDGVRLLERVVITHVPAAKSSNNRLLLSVAPELPGSWDCDPCMIRQLLDNLLGNAIKFTQGGDVVVQALSGKGRRALVLRISNTGKGRGLKQGKRLHRRSRCNDLGLGLPICQLILQAFKGEMSYGNRASGGVSVEITIPEILNGEAAGFRDSGSLFDQVMCHLRLPEPMLSCTGNVLQRLGVVWEAHKPQNPGGRLCLEIRESTGETGYGLLLLPKPEEGTSVARKMTSVPLLESSLGALLLEMLLEWRSDRFSRGNQDSAR